MAANTLRCQGHNANFDVIFQFGRSSFSCERSLFVSASPLMRQVFQQFDSDHTLLNINNVSLRKCPTSNNAIVHLDAPSAAFELVHAYLHNPSLKIEPSLLPAVCNVAKKFEFEEIWRSCAEQLVHSISLNNIGEVCALVCLADGDGCMSPSDSCERELIAATRSFILENANAIACSQTGTLSARLYLDVLESPDDDNFTESCSLGSSSSILNDWSLTDRVLQFCSKRLQERESLDNRDSGYSEDIGARKLTNKAHASARDTVTDEIRMTISDAELRVIGYTSLSKMSLASAESGGGGQRHPSSGSEPAPSPVSSSLSPSRTPPSVISRSLGGATSADKETCLIAKTGLGIGTTSIHLGKLEGRLVSLSVKRRPAPQHVTGSTAASVTVSSASSSVAGTSGDASALGGLDPQLTMRHPSPITSSVMLPPSPPPFAMSPGCLHDDLHDGELSPPISLPHNYSVLRSFGCLPSSLTEARSGAGACLLPSPDTDPQSRRLLLTGGYSHGGCLRTTEVLKLTTPSSSASFMWDRRSSIMSDSANSDFDSASMVGGGDWLGLATTPGPAMRTPRGRLALAAVDRQGGLAFACGGCDGTRDLASVECLAMDTNFSSSPSAEVSGSSGMGTWRYVASMQQARSHSAAATLADQSRVMVLGGQCAGTPLSSVECYDPERDEWTFLPPMTDARGQLCAATLASRNLVISVGGVGETVSTPSAVSSASPVFFEMSESPASGEAFDPRCSRWIRLPDLINRGPLIGATLVPLSASSGRMLLIGGSDGHSATAQTQIFDSRAWTWLLGPTISIGRVSPSAVSLFPSSSSSSLPCVAVIGGYNVTAGGFLNSVELVGVTQSSSFRGCPSPISIAATPLSASPPTSNPIVVPPCSAFV